MSDPYFYKGTTTLKNQFDLKDGESLNAVERLMTAVRSMELKMNPAIIQREQTNLLQLQAIHKYLFQDVYHWAGELRTIQISKGNTLFAHPEYIKGYMGQVFKTLNQDDLKNLSLTDFTHKATYYMAEVNAVHPFREGNGRSTRKLIDQMANTAGYTIDWQQISQHEMIEASKESMQADPVKLRQFFTRATSSQQQNQTHDQVMMAQERTTSDQSSMTQRDQFADAIRQQRPVTEIKQQHPGYTRETSLLERVQHIADKIPDAAKRAVFLNVLHHGIANAVKENKPVFAQDTYHHDHTPTLSLRQKP